MKKVELKKLGDISSKDIGKLIITEGTVEVVYPIKEDFLKYYIIVDSSSPLQRSIYLQMNTEHRRYVLRDTRSYITLLHAPLYFYEGQRIRIMAKVVKYRGSVALKFKKLF